MMHEDRRAPVAWPSRKGLNIVHVDARERMSASSLTRRIEPWYLAYLLLGFGMAGVAPILLPLAVAERGSAAQVGLVMAAFSLGGLTAPLWGALADRFGIHRWLLAGGLLATALGLAGFVVQRSISSWLLLALVQSGGAAAAATVADLFVVEVHPRTEWDARLGWLQTSYGVGQVGGLLLAGLAGQTNVAAGLLAAAALMVVAIAPGWTGPHAARRAATPHPAVPHPARHAEWPVSSPHRLYPMVGIRAATLVEATARGRSGRFLVAWVLSFGGAAAVFSLYPVLMGALFGVGPSLSSTGFAVAAALGISLYAPAGGWSQRAGPMRVLRGALALRLVSFVAMLGLGLAHPQAQGPLALATFVLIVLSWSALSVSGTALAARLLPGGEGEALGLYNAATAVAGVLGAALGGGLAARWGYAAAPALAVLGVAIGLALTFGVPDDLGTEAAG